MDYIKDEHRVHLIVYHLIWCTKRLKPVLVENVAKDCKSLIEQKCNQHGWNILNINIKPDHIHLFVRVYPTVSAAYVIKECKRLTSFELRKKHPELRKLPCMWTSSYLASTAGNVSAEIFQKYIDAQSKS